jgi:hypothetical protein
MMKMMNMPRVIMVFMNMMTMVMMNRVVSVVMIMLMDSAWGSLGPARSSTTTATMLPSLTRPLE